MKKLLFSLIFFLFGYSSFAVPCYMGDPTSTACINYDAVTGKTTVKVSHFASPTTPWLTNCSYSYWYAAPLITWLYVKNPSGPGFFGPFKITANIPHDPSVGAAYTYYDVTIPGFSTQQCYEVYIITNASWSAFDPYNSWGYTPAPGLDPSLPNCTNYWSTPLGVPACIYSTENAMLACVCEGSDTMGSCNSNFTLKMSKSSSPSSFPIVDFSCIVELKEYHPLSSYFINWGSGLVPYSGTTASIPYISPSGTYTVCIYEVINPGDTCKSCMEFCVPTSTGSGMSSVMRNSEVSLDMDELFQLSPNPSNSNTDITFSLPKNEMVQIWVTDISGKLVVALPPKMLSAGKQKIELNTASITPGLYHVKLVFGKETKTRKLSITR